MDAQTFDRWTAALSRRPSRRAALRLLAGSLAAGLLAQRGAAPARALQPDRDGDGLYDDDETDVYGTNPDVFDTDGDGTGDGEEIYNRDNGLGGPSDPLTPDGGAPAPAGCAAGLTDCGGICVDLVNDRNHCGRCGGACAEFVNCWESNCGGIPDAPPPGCGPGLTECDHVCVDLLANEGHCGVCGNACGLRGECQGGVCVVPACPAGQTACGAWCSILEYDVSNCGACGRVCPEGTICCGGGCVNIFTDIANCGGCHEHCFTPVIGDAECVNGVCNP